jgi:hypothetical protein
MLDQNPLDAAQYPAFLSLTYQVVQSIQDRISEDPRWPDCQELAAKLFFHSATIYWLRQGTEAPLPGTGKKASFYDLTSTSVLVRACLDSYLTLYDVFFRQTCDDDFEYAHALWRLAGEAVREGVVPSDPSLNRAYNQAQENIAHLRARVQATSKWKSLAQRQKRKALAGVRSVDWGELAHAAGFGKQMIRRMRAFYSGHVHADGLSTSQVIGSQSAAEQIEHIDTDMSTVLIVLSKFICLYAAKFPEAMTVCVASPDFYHRAVVLDEAARRIP